VGRQRDGSRAKWEGKLRVGRNPVVRVFVTDLARGTTGSGAASARPSSRRLAAERSSATGPYRWLREPRWRVISWTLALSAALHVALTPFAGLLGLMAWLLAPPPQAEVEAEQLRSIPITLLSDEELGQIEAYERAREAASTAAVSEAVLPTEPAAPAPARAAEPSPPASPARPPPPPAPKVGPVPARGDAEGIGHPVAMSGVTSEVVDSNANVNLLMVTERLRRHPLGTRIGRLIVDFPQWSSFFESGEIDPVRDINRILIVGPQFRRSADVVAILEHDLPQPVLRAAVDRLVQRPPRGRWLKAKFPAARAHADRAERLFALTAPHVIVVAPLQLERQILATPPTHFPSPQGDAALVLHVKTPWRALAGLPLALPPSLAWLRLDVIPNDDGGALVGISAEDADAQQAADHAQSLSMALNALTNPDLGALGALIGLRSIAFVDKIHFQARDRRISGQVRVTPRQLERLLAYAEEFARAWTGRRSDGTGSLPPASPAGKPAATKPSPPIDARRKAPAPNPPTPRQ
jgi:hypothetical protein